MDAHLRMSFGTAPSYAESTRSFTLMYDAVLFDFDGVLADTEPLHYAAWQKALEPLGITFDWDFYRTQGIGISDHDLLALLARRRQPPLPVETLWQRYGLKKKIFLELAMAAPPIPAAVAELINSLNHLKLAVVTSTSRSEVVPLLAAADLLGRFQVVIAAEDVAAHKPDPEPYLTAAERLGSRRGLAVEDSEAGAASARAAGLEVLRVCGPGDLVERLPARVWRGEPSVR